MDGGDNVTPGDGGGKEDAKELFELKDDAADESAFKLPEKKVKRCI